MTLAPRSLRWRLGASSAAVFVVVLAGSLWAVSLLVERALIDNTTARLELEAGLIQPTSPGRGNAPATSLAAPELVQLLGGQQTAVAILDASGTTLATESNGAEPGVVEARVDAGTYGSVLATGGTVNRVVQAPSIEGGRVLVVLAPIRFEGRVSSDLAPDAPSSSTGPSDQGNGNGKGKGNGNGNGRGLGNQAKTDAAGPPNAVAQLAVSLDAVDATLGSLRAGLLTLGLVAVLVATLLIFVLTAIGLRPLRRVAAVADDVAAGDLSARTGLPSGEDEIGRLGRAFDRMVGRIEASFVAQRQFAADASHELRSPLTVLGGYVDILAHRAETGSEEAAAILQSMRREIDRLSRLASDLLLLTQLEAGGGRLSPEPVDVGDLLGDLGQAALAIGSDRRVQVARQGPLIAMADRDRITQSLLNLVDNAVRHTPPAGLVRLSGWRDHEVIVAEVHNEGSPIPAEHLAHLFDRFYRADRSVEPGRHAGLGLAIAKAIVEASGGTIAVDSDDAGTRFTVRLPVDPASITATVGAGSLQEASATLR